MFYYKETWGRPRTGWGDGLSGPACERLRVPPAELEEISTEGEVPAEAARPGQVGGGGGWMDV